MYKKILIGVDDSEDSYKAVEAGIELARILNAKITFLYIETDSFIKEKYGGEENISKSQTQVDDYLLQQARTMEIGKKVMEKVSRLADEQLGKQYFETKIISGHPAEAFLEELTSNDYDLVIVGRRGASQAQRTVFGTIISHVIKDTSIPCLIAGSNKGE